MPSACWRSAPQLSVDAEEYVTFLKALLRRVTCADEHGFLIWRQPFDVRYLPPRSWSNDPRVLSAFAHEFVDGSGIRSRPGKRSNKWDRVLPRSAARSHQASPRPRVEPAAPVSASTPPSPRHDGRPAAHRDLATGSARGPLLYGHLHAAL